MSFSAGTAYVDLTLGKTDALKSGMAAEGALAGETLGGKIKSGLFSTVAGLAGPIIGIMALDKLFEFVKGGAQDWAELQAATRQTNAVLLSTAGAANISAQGISDLTETLSKKTAMDDSVIRSGENMLLTFTNVKNQVGAGNDIFNQATATILDMSKALGQDTKTSAIQLGKALNDPVMGMTALQRVGVTFTSQQKDQIKTMVASNNTLGAQKVILAELNKEFGGSAAAGATAGARLSLTMKDLAMNLYGLFAPLKLVGITFTSFIVTPIADGVAKLIPLEQKWVADWKSVFNQAKNAAQGLDTPFPKAANALEQFASVVGVLVGNIKKQLDVVKEAWQIVVDGFTGTPVGPVSSELQGVSDKLQAFGAAAHEMWTKVQPILAQWGPAIGTAIASALGVVVLVGAFEAVGKAAEFMGTNIVGAFKALLSAIRANPILMIVAAIAGAIVLLYQMSPAFRKFVQDMFNAFMPVAEQLMPILSKAFQIAMTVIGDVLQLIIPLIEPVLDFLDKAVHAISDFIKGGGVQSAGGGFIAWIVNAFGVVKGIFDNVVSFIADAANQVGKWLSYMFSPLAPLIPKFQTFFSQLADGFNAAFTVIKEVLGPVVNALFPLIWQQLQAAWLIIHPILTTLGSIFADVFGTIWNVVQDVFNGITQIIRGAMQIISGIIGAVLDLITGNWKGLGDDLMSIVNGIGNILGGLWNGIMGSLWDIIKGGISIIVDIFEGLGSILLGAGQAALNGFLNGVQFVWGVINSWFGGIPSRILGAIGDLGSLLYGAGQAILNGFLNGLKSIWNNITGFVGNIADWISSHKGPISYDRTLLVPHGQAIMQSLLQGLQSESGTIEDWLTTFTNNLTVGAQIGVSSAVKGSGALSSNKSTGSTTYNVYEATDANSTAMAINRIQTNAARVS